MFLIDTIIFLLWGLFFAAAVFGLFQEYQNNRKVVEPRRELEDDDPVFLV
ncbi:MAG: hypothetical protein AAFY71_07985 [Bacteroidota bacterium]